ncbi:hypothetical protein HMPREF9470_05597 [[Clostridium] citroniae WAL-19142]|uniref:Lipocalin-like domain-containing protein n=1 Tax=[Clostridium] citroniae WAL-19142 TaxID=742734 RepID=A0A0J9BCN1_9FIRM|nr:hypothetical protein HMPREF9470_05597 [[Clostridium] citroniae WAL-19142]
MLALVLCLSMTACGKNGSNEEDVINGDETGYEEDVSNGGEISIEDLDGFWYPVDGIGLTTSVLTSIYVDGAAGTWEEYDQYGDPTGNTGDAYTDGTVLTVADVSFLGEVEDVEIPIGDADTLLDDDGEIYWIKGQPDFKEKLGLSNIFGNWYYKGDHTSEYQTVLTLNEDGTYTRSDTEEGTYTFEEMEVSTTDVNTNETTTELRQEVRLSGGFMDAPFYLVNDGQVLVDWAKVNEGEEFYIHESALENGELLRLYQITDGNDYWGEDYTLQFLRENTLYRNYLNGAQDSVSGTWEISGDMITITWDDGETDEAILNPEKPDSLTLNSTGETIAKLF